MKEVLTLGLVALAGLAAFVMLKPKGLQYQAYPVQPTNSDAYKWGALSNMFGSAATAAAVGMSSYFSSGGGSGGGSYGGGGGGGAYPSDPTAAAAQYWNSVDSNQAARDQYSAAANGF